MKKIILLLSSLLIALTFVSCGKKPLLDDCGCYMSLFDAQNAAKKSGKNILFIVTETGEDYASENFVNDILMTYDFDEKIAANYEVYHADFSTESFQRTVASEGATKEEQKTADEYGSIMKAAYEFAIILDMQYTPALYILTQDKYVIAEVNYDQEILDVNALSDLLHSYDQAAVDYKEMVAKTKKGSKKDRILAMNELYEATDPAYQSILYDMVKKIPEMDPENKTGIAGNYVIVKAEAEAIPKFTDGDIQGAVQCYLDAVSSPYIPQDDIQQAYFMCAYLSSQLQDNILVLNYLETALKVNPESDKAEGIKQAIEYFSGLAQQENDNMNALIQGITAPDENDIQLSN